MRWKRKLAITVLAAAASAIGGTEIAKKRFSNGKGAAYRKFLDKVIHYKNKEEGQAADEMKEVGQAVADQTAGYAKSDDAKTDHAKADDAKTDDAKSDDAKSDESAAYQ